MTPLVGKAPGFLWCDERDGTGLVMVMNQNVLSHSACLKSLTSALRVQTSTIHSHNTAKYRNMFALRRTYSNPKWPGWFQVPSLILLLYLMNHVDSFLCNRKHWLCDFLCCAFINLVIALIYVLWPYYASTASIEETCLGSVSRCLTFSTP